MENHNRDILGGELSDADDQNRNLRLKGSQFPSLFMSQSYHIHVLQTITVIHRSNCVASFQLFAISGQMIYMENWRMIMFLGTPVMPELTSLINTGIEQAAPFNHLRTIALVRMALNCGILSLSIFPSL